MEFVVDKLISRQVFVTAYFGFPVTVITFCLRPGRSGFGSYQEQTLNCHHCFVETGCIFIRPPIRWIPWARLARAAV
jgi:hypothetical protein